jgi:hypothetical protein
MHQNLQHCARRRLGKKDNTMTGGAPARGKESTAFTLQVEVIADSPEASQARPLSSLCEDTLIDLVKHRFNLAATHICLQHFECGSPAKTIDWKRQPFTAIDSVAEDLDSEGIDARDAGQPVRFVQAERLLPLVAML